MEVESRREEGDRLWERIEEAGGRMEEKKRGGRAYGVQDIMYGTGGSKRMRFRSI